MEAINLGNGFYKEILDDDEIASNKIIVRNNFIYRFKDKKPYVILFDNYCWKAVVYDSFPCNLSFVDINKCSAEEKKLYNELIDVMKKDVGYLCF